MSEPTTLTLLERGSKLATGRDQITLLESLPVEADFDRSIGKAGLDPLTAAGVEILQVNVGRLCNQTCVHCHVDAGPTRREVMTQETAELCMEVLARTDVPTVDITGGAPEMCPSFRYLVEESRRLGRHVMDRCNLTILTHAKYEDLPEFLAANGVEVVCSLPHYRELNTDRQRGTGVYERSIAGLRRLNELGYAQEGTGLKLVLVTNPVGAFVPNHTASTTAEWKRELLRQHGVRFDDLYTITNMPISRFLEWLADSGNLEGYLDRLVNAFNPGAARGVMCRNTLSVGWDGALYDCDFNQMLDLGVDEAAPRPGAHCHLVRLASRRIVTGRHCYGCTAGSGSSCGGQIL